MVLKKLEILMGHQNRKFMGLAMLGQQLLSLCFLVETVPIHVPLAPDKNGTYVKNTLPRAQARQAC